MFNPATTHRQRLQEWIEDDLKYEEYAALVDLLRTPTKLVGKQVCIDQGRDDRLKRLYQDSQPIFLFNSLFWSPKIYQLGPIVT